MKKYIGIALAVLMVVAFSGMVNADTVANVDWSSSNPNITVTSHLDGAHELEEGTSMFTLHGTGYSTGHITASASSIGWGSAEISGGFDAENGDFDSFFGSRMTEAGSPNTWHVTQEGYNEHSLSAIGVTDLYVGGYAVSTSYNNLVAPNAGQSFVGEADSVYALGIGFLKWDSNYDGNLDSSYGASIELSGDGTEPFGFEGYTGSSRSLYPNCFGWAGNAHPDKGSLNYDLYSENADLLTAGLFTDYSYAKIGINPSEVWGETSP